MLELNKIYFEDCVEGMKKIDGESIDMILCDLPYGVTARNKWDNIIPFDLLWKSYERVIKNNGAIILTATQPFTSALVMSNLKLFKYEWIWEKSKASNFLSSRKQPLKAHENILVFSKKSHKYNPQKTKGKPYSGDRRAGWKGSETSAYGVVPNPLFRNGNATGDRFPRSVQYFITAESEGKQTHPSQKPVGLFEYLIKTYTDENELVLDNCMGSGTTAIACKNTNRNFIGFENDPNYYEIATKRIKNWQKVA